MHISKLKSAHFYNNFVITQMMAIEEIYNTIQAKIQFLHYNKSDFFQGSKPLKKVLKNLKKIILRAQLTLDNPQNIYRRQENFNSLRSP